VLVWFAVRREWRSLAVALLTTATIAGVSTVWAPGEWVRWVRFLTQHGGESGYMLYLRVSLALGITVVAARRDTPWLLAPAMFLSCPVVHGINNIIILMAIPRLVMMRRPVAPTGREVSGPGRRGSSSPDQAADVQATQLARPATPSGS
jgi:hypothetical protein